jgi:hypothetical protein
MQILFHAFPSNGGPFHHLSDSMQGMKNSNYEDSVVRANVALAGHQFFKFSEYLVT